MQMSTLFTSHKILSLEKKVKVVHVPN